MKVTKLGVCVTPDFLPSTHEALELNAPFYRSILYASQDLQTLKATGKPILLTLNNQCSMVGSDWSGWQDAVKEVCDTLRDQLLVLGCGNELDSFWVKDNNNCPPEFAAQLVIDAKKIARDYRISVASTSVASDAWTGYMQLLAPLIIHDVDYIDIHPYGQQPNGWGPPNWMFGKLENAIHQMQNILNKPVICSEYGVKIQDAGSTQEVGNFLDAAKFTLDALGVSYCSWFAWTDEIGTATEQGTGAFGLRAADGSHRPAWDVYKRLTGGSTNLDRWRATVGKGLLDMMEADHTEPALNSEWRPFDRAPGEPAIIEQCVGMNGTTYMWHLPTNTSWRTRAS